jgi:HEAT repeat protein
MRLLRRHGHTDFQQEHAMTSTDSPTLTLPGHLDSSREIAILVRALTWHGPMPPQRARELLCEIGAPALPALRELLRKKDPVSRWEAANAMAAIADAQAAPDLTKALSDPDAGVRWIAAEGLAAIGMPAIEPLLRQLMAHSESVWLRDGTQHTLRAMAAREGSLPPVLRHILTALDGASPERRVLWAATKALGAVASNGPD